MKAIRRKIQVIFQDPYSSLNPRMTVGQIIGEPLHVYRLVADRKAEQARVAQLLEQVGLRPEMAARYPHQLSGGQRQRVGIARALAMEPSFIVCDEAVSALDVSIQGQIINLLEDLQRRLGLTYLFIAHDLAVVRHISMRVVVMYFGRVDGSRRPRRNLSRPAASLHQGAARRGADSRSDDREGARAAADQGRIAVATLSPPSGCVFNTRCPMASRGMPARSSRRWRRSGRDTSRPASRCEAGQRRFSSGAIDNVSDKKHGEGR